MKFLAAVLCVSLLGCAGAPREEKTVEESASRNSGKVIGTLGGAGTGAAMGYSSAGLLCTIGGPLCMIVVVPAAIVGGVVGLAAGGVVDAVSAAPQRQGPLPGGTSAPQGG